MANPTPQRSRWDVFTEYAVGLALGRHLGLMPRWASRATAPYDLSLNDDGLTIARVEVRRRDFGPNHDFARAAVVNARKIRDLVECCEPIGALPLYALALRDGSIRMIDARTLASNHAEPPQPFRCRGAGERPDPVWYVDVRELSLMHGLDWLAQFRALTCHPFDWEAARAAHPRHVMR